MTVRQTEARELVRSAQNRGWRVRPGGHGFVVRCPGECMCQVSIANSPGSHRYFQNVASKLRRCPAWSDAC